MGVSGILFQILLPIILADFSNLHIKEAKNQMKTAPQTCTSSGVKQHPPQASSHLSGEEGAAVAEDGPVEQPVGEVLGGRCVSYHTLRY